LSSLEDAALEKELKEIALNGRSGMISGTPGAHDIEKGKSVVKPARPIGVEDEADKSFNTLVPNQSNKKQRRQRWMLLLCVLGLLAITGGLLYVLLGKAETEEKVVPFEDPDLSNRQQAMDNIMGRITDPAILSHPNSPQYEARQWLLFTDREIIEVVEERVVQRYALACLYFATGGKESWNIKNWLDGYECAEDAWMGIGCNPMGDVRALVLGKWNYGGCTIELIRRFEFLTPQTLC
jgi:hypothetical protein